MTPVIQFLKKNYEKVLLGLVLFGLIVAAAFLPFRIANEKDGLQALREKKFDYPVQPLPPLDTNRYVLALQRVATPLQLDLTSSNKLLNPVRWLKGPSGPIKMPVGEELKQLEITRISPLYLTISLDSVNVSETGARYGIVIDDQAAARPNLRRKSYFVSIGDRKDAFNVIGAKGPQDNPTALTLALADSGDQISISKDKAFRRIDGYMADLKYSPENKTFAGRHVGDKLAIAGEEYNIVAITENEVVLSARSNGKKYTIRYNAAP